LLEGVEEGSTLDKRDKHFLLHHLDMMAVISQQEINNQFLSWLSQGALNGDEIVMRQAILRDSDYVLRQKFPEVYSYSVSLLIPGFQDVDSVFEIYVDPYGICGASMNMKSSAKDAYKSVPYQQAILEILYIFQNQTISSYGKLYNDVSVVTSNADLDGMGKTIRAINFCQAGIRCQIRFDAAMDSNVTSLMAFLMTVDDRVQPFIRFILYWARTQQLQRKCPEILSILTAMALVYLMRKSVIPSILTLQQMTYSTPSEVIAEHSVVEGWNVSFSRDAERINNYLRSKGKVFLEQTIFESSRNMFVPKSLDAQTSSAVLQYLHEFFFCYGTNQLNQYMISPFLGDTFSKRGILDSMENSPQDMPFWKRIQEVCSGLDFSKELLIQHPFNLGLNLAQNMDSSCLLYLQGLFREQAVKFEKNLQSVNPTLLDLFPDLFTLVTQNQTVKRQHYDSGCSSVSVMTQENIQSEDLPVVEMEHPNVSKVVVTHTMSYSLAAKKAAVSTNSIPPLQQSKHAPSPLDGSVANASGSPLRCFKLEMSRQFQIAFIETCQSLGSMSKLKEKLNILAVIFMRDFSFSTWGRCFYMTNDTRKVLDTDAKFQQISRMFREYFAPNRYSVTNGKNSAAFEGHVMSDILEHEPLRLDVSGSSDEGDDGSGGHDASVDSAPLDTAEDVVSLSSESSPASKDSKIEWNFAVATHSLTKGVSASDSSERVNILCTTAYKEMSEKEKREDLRVKFGKIPKCACKNYCVTMKLRGFQKIWVNRRTVRTDMMFGETQKKGSGGCFLEKLSVRC
jgi:hypothetical protein